MDNITLLIHGWSSNSTEFEHLKNFLKNADIGNVDSIYYGDYESREDNITFNDIVDGFRDRMIEKGFIDYQNNPLVNLNVIVHSTGGLIIRHWIWRYYYSEGNIKNCPVKKIVMLAPANFGSPLAHRGKSFFGQIVMGRWKFGDFLEVGRKILDGLELGSPYQWDLAHKDLFIEEQYYNFENIQLTILVGIEVYKGFKKLVNKPGTDGTVVISGTTINSVKLSLDFSRPEFSKKSQEWYVPNQWVVEDPIDDFCFGVLRGLDHGSILSESSNPSHPSNLSNFILEALKVKTKKQFEDLKNVLLNVTEETYKHYLGDPSKHKYQQFIVHACDDNNLPVYDFTLEFFIIKKSKFKNGLFSNVRLSGNEMDYSDLFNKILTSEFHTFSNDKSYRRFLVDINQVSYELKRVENDPEFKEGFCLSMKMYVPNIDRGIRYQNENTQNIVLHDSTKEYNNGLTLFKENTTTLIELKVDRVCDYVWIEKFPRKH